MAILPTSSSSRKTEHVFLIGMYAHTDKIFLSVCTNMLGMHNDRTIRAESTPALLSAWKQEGGEGPDKLALITLLSWLLWAEIETGYYT